MSANGDVSTTCQCHYSLAFTVNLKNAGGIKKGCILEELICKYLTKQGYGFVCAEKEFEERHLHGQVFWDLESRGKKKSEFKKILIDYSEKYLKRALSPVEKKCAFKIKIAYSDDFYSEYCAKEDQMIWENMPEDTTPYYPSKEIQEQAIRKSQAVDHKYFNLEENFLEYNNNLPPKDIKEIAMFIYDSMFVSRTMLVQQCPKKRKQLIECLYEYILKDKSRYISFLLPEESKKQKEVDKWVELIDELG